MKKPIAFIIPILLVIFLIRFTPTTGLGADDAHTVVASVAIFSGRHDPQWQINNTNDFAVVRDKLKSLEPVGEPKNWNRLGFRGIILNNNSVPQLPSYLRVFRGTVQIGIGADKSFYGDKNGVECWLVRRAIEQHFENGVHSTLTNYAANFCP